MASIEEDINLVCLSDVHHAQDSSNEDLLIHDLSQPLQNRLIIGVGDELDSIARGDKRHKLEDLKDRFTTKETYPKLVDAEIDDYCGILSSLTKPEEWLGHISGNHPLVMTEHGVDPVERMCIILGHKYLGYSAFVPLNITYSTNTRLKCMIMCHHGFGGGGARKEGSGINAYIDHALRYEGWDIALYGHRHDRFVKTVPRIMPQAEGNSGRSPWVRSVDRKVVQCGTYQRTLSHSKYPTYAEKAGYPPRPIGCVVLRFGILRTNENGARKFQLEFRGSNE